MAEPELGIPFCGVPHSELAEVGAACKWRHDTVTLSHRVDLGAANISAAQVDDVFARVAATWSAACGIDLRFVPGLATANILAESGPLDGRNGVLGRSYLPCGNVGPSSQLGQLYDVGEVWTVSFFFRTALHEVGHAIGLDHAPGGTAVMSPYLTAFETLQKWDIDQSVLRYKGPKPIPIPPATPPPIGPDVVDLLNGVEINVPGAKMFPISEAGLYGIHVARTSKINRVKLSLFRR